MNTTQLQGQPGADLLQELEEILFELKKSNLEFEQETYRLDKALDANATDMEAELDEIETDLEIATQALAQK